MSHIAIGSVQKRFEGAWKMSLTTTGIIGIVILVILLYSKMPVGFAMGFLGLIGFSYVVNLEAGLNLLARDVWDVFSSYNLTVIPLFVFMGQIAFHAGISRRLYDSAYVLLGHRRGGLAMTTVGACAGFSAICGSTNATAATMATVALPEMKRYGYDMGLATGTVAAAGSLGILIPPSVIFIVYGILTEQSIGKLFAAGILPGILLCFLFLDDHSSPGHEKPLPCTARSQNQFQGKIQVLCRCARNLDTVRPGHGRHFFRHFHTHRGGGHRRFFDPSHRRVQETTHLAWVYSIPCRHHQNQLHDHGDCDRRRDIRSFYGHYPGTL